MTNPNPDPLVGRTVGQYQILARIGGGGMGVVYTARDARLSRTVALKFLPPQWSHDETAKERFVREAQAASATNHPNICTIHDIETADDGQLFIVMAYYEGQTLKTRLESGRLPIEEALDLATQVADGLARAHAQGVVHRDIKPGNVILTEDGARILDFGLATFADALKLTVENAPLGTVAYMSPEQVRGQQADARADVWAAGAVLYEMLTGHPPFRGSHAEAIGYAVRNEPPTPIRAERPEVPEDVEQLVFRALHKEPGVRYASGRELSRALRQVRGLSVPLELRTQTIPTPPTTAARIDSPRPARSPRTWVVSSAILGVAGLALAWWLTRPIERIPIVVAPVVDQSGYSTIATFRYALTQQLTDALAGSSRTRPLSYSRFLELVRPFRTTRSGEIGPDVLQELVRFSGARVIVVPTVTFENGVWKAKADLRDPASAVSMATLETEPLPQSPLERSVAQRLMSLLAARVHDYFVDVGPLHGQVVEAARRLRRRGGTEPAIVVSPPNAAASFEAGLDAYEQLEYGAALHSFSEASDASNNAVVLAWLSRAAQLMRHDSEAADAAARAVKALVEPMSERDRLFVEAVGAEARRDFATAEARHRTLVSRYGDEQSWHAELGAFLDRRGSVPDAILAYQEALARDQRTARPDIELCRLYNRANERFKAIEHGRRALMKYQAIAHEPGTAQAEMCLADALKEGNERARIEARGHADSAAKTLTGLNASYNLARARYYVAMIAGLQGDLLSAISVGQQALTAARASGNNGLEPLLLMNLGVAHARMRHQAPALDYYRQSSARFEALGDEYRAAQNHLNAGWLVIDHGGNLEDGARDVTAALAVFEHIGDKTFEVYCRHALSSYFLFRGDVEQAERQMNRAIELANTRSFDETMRTLLIDDAVIRWHRADYEGARGLLDMAIGNASEPDAPRALIRRSQTFIRIGDFASATKDLAQAAELIRIRKNTALDAMFHAASGELAYQSGDRIRAEQTFRKVIDGATNTLLDPDVVSARARLAPLAVASGNVAAGRRLADDAVSEARHMGRLSLEAEALIARAQVEISAHRFDDALKALDAVPDGPGKSIGVELSAKALYQRAIVRAARGDAAGASGNLAESRRLLESIRSSLTAEHRPAFMQRRELKEIFSADVRTSPAVR